MAGHHSAEDGGRNVVEEARQDKDDPEQRDAPGPIVRQQTRQMIGHIAVLEMTRQQLKADEQQQQVGNRDPFMLEMAKQGLGAGAGWEGADKSFVGQDDDQPGDADRERPFVEQRDAEQHEAEKDELNRDPHGDLLATQFLSVDPTAPLMSALGRSCH